MRRQGALQRGLTTKGFDQIQATPQEAPGILTPERRAAVENHGAVSRSAVQRLRGAAAKAKTDAKQHNARAQPHTREESSGGEIK